MAGCNNAADWPGPGNPAEFRDGLAVRDTSDATKVVVINANSGQTTGTRVSFTMPAFNSTPLSQEIKQCSATVTKTTSTTLSDVTGLTGFTLVANGVYAFEVYLQTVCTTNSGIGVALKYTTATVSAIQVEATTFAASSMATARSTTTADATLYINNKTAAWLVCILRGTLTVGTAGTVAIQMAQESSHADATSVFIGSHARFTRIS
jgi:hypothetical protein